MYKQTCTNMYKLHGEEQTEGGGQLQSGSRPQIISVSFAHFGKSQQGGSIRELGGNLLGCWRCLAAET